MNGAQELVAKQEAAIRSAACAHRDLARSLGELRALVSVPTVARHVSIAITEAEGSFLWLRAAAEMLGVEVQP